MKIKPGSTATLQYRILDAETQEIIDLNSENTPVSFRFGQGKLLPEFEKNMTGLSVGDKFDFVIKAEDAYGKKDPYATFDIPLDTFETDGKIDDKMLRIGNTIPMTDNEGRKHMGKIVKITEHAVLMDFNHPLAGKNIRFIGKVIDVKP